MNRYLSFSRLKLSVAVVGAMALSACSSVSAPSYYSLQTNGASPTHHALSEQSAQSSMPAAQSAQAILVNTVGMPAQIDRRQIVLNLRDNQGVQLLNDYQWASALSDEYRMALNALLTQSLGLPTADAVGKDTYPYWQVDVTVQRFESVFDDYVRQDVSWRLAPVNFSATPQLCRTSVQQPVTAGVEGLAAGHQALTAQVAGFVTQQMQGQALRAKDANNTVLALHCSATSASTSPSKQPNPSR